MKASEHRTIGDAAAGGALVNVGGDLDAEPFALGFGDVVALSGDYFTPEELFHLARLPGDAGARPGTRDEIVCALKVAAVDEELVDPRFEPGGRFASYKFTDVERRVRDRYLALAATNDDHFAAPGWSTAVSGSGHPTARSAYCNFHRRALDEAWRLGREGGDVAQAMAREAAAQHYLTDAFAAGHLRTPVATIRSHWKERYPGFWDQLQRRVASETARALRDLSWTLRALSDSALERRALAEVRTRTRAYPALSLGDLIARCFHDWDNVHGLEVEGGGIIFGDGRIDAGVTKPLAVAAARTGVDAVRAAFELGASGRRLRGPLLYQAVRDVTGDAGAESHIPRVSARAPAQNWHAADVDGLWDAPMVGDNGTTVGQALLSMLEPGGDFLRQVDSLGQGLGGLHGVFAVPFVGTWLSAMCRQAFHDGFVGRLADDPQSVLRDLVGEGGKQGRWTSAPTDCRNDPDSICSGARGVEGFLPSPAS